MGDRGQIRVIENEVDIKGTFVDDQDKMTSEYGFVYTKLKHDIYLYTHFTGTMLQDILADALENAEERWRDSEYLTRIIFCYMMSLSYNNKDALVHDTTGFGIGNNEHCDLDHPLITVNTTHATVEIEGQKYRFQEFIELIKEE